MHECSIQLRLLATTDLHMHLRAWDYAKDQPFKSGALTRIATQIAAARAEATAEGAYVLLFDNGDGLQGTAVGDMASDAAEQGEPHPLMTAFEQLEYDALGLGNHDFDRGAAPLAQVTRQAHCPVLCANLRHNNSELLEHIQPCTILAAGPLRVGVLSVLPPQTAMWNTDVLAGEVTFADMTETVDTAASQLRQDGCHIVLLLAHTGIGEAEHRPGQENAVLPLSRLPSVTAIFAGHTHLPFSGMLPDAGGTPVALAGAGGAQLAQIDLTLSRDPAGVWQVNKATPSLRRTDGATCTEDPTLSDLFAPWHTTAREIMNRPSGHTDERLHSYFSMIRPDAHLRQIAEAKRACFAILCPDAPDLPVIAAVAPGKCGGRGESGNYVDVPKGPVLRRHLDDLVVFPNLLRTVELDGRDLRAWMEVSASVFHRIVPGGQKQPLLDVDWPPHSFDAFFGLNYQIDVSQPARYRADGSRNDTDGQRIRDLSWQGEPVRDDQKFIVLLTSYRASGGGNVQALANAQPLPLPDAPVREAVERQLTQPGPAAYPDLPWRFADLGGTPVLLPTGPRATEVLSDIRDLHPITGTTDTAGFLTLTLHL